MKTVELEEKLLEIRANMYSFALTLTADKEDAADLVQDAILKVLENQDKYIDNKNFKGWVLTIMRNIFINNYRKVVRSQTIIDRTEDLYFLNVCQNSGFETPECSYNVKEITAAVNNLKPDLRISFSLFLAGYKYDEIADKLNIALGTVKSRIFFARKQLQADLAGMRH